MSFTFRARIAGIVSVALLLLSAPGSLAGTSYQPDAEIRLGSGSYVGDTIVNTTGLAQAVSNSGVVGQKMTFFIRIRNDSCCFADTFKVKRSGLFHEGYRVRYYDAGGTDVTGQINAGTFTTPQLDALGAEEYVMRATVKIRPLATACSHVTRLIIVTSIGDPARKDAVRFAASLDPNCPPTANDDANSITEDAAPDAVFGNVFANDSDPDGDPLTVTSVEAPQYGFFSINVDNGNYSYTLDNTNTAFLTLDDSQTLPESIDYEVSDGHGGTDTATLLITIHGTTDP